MPKVILISQTPLPFSGIGSWTTLYKNYLEANHKIDYLVCKKPEKLLTTLEYGYVNNNLVSKIEAKFKQNKYISYFKAVKKIMTNNSDTFIIQIIDNHGIVKPLIDYLKKNNLQEKSYIQFFFHGHGSFFGNFESRLFFESINEMIVLTHDCYKVHKNYYTVLPCKFSILHNGIDINKFFKISNIEKQKLKLEIGYTAKKTFVWCSQDRPKKGLHLILDVWKRVYNFHNDCELVVIGTEKKPSTKGVRFLGKIANDDLPKFFQAADVYLFPTLWQEGFGLSLIEALHCGNYCIASALGGVPEVLQYGKLGKLIENPHFIHEWIDAIEDYLQNNYHAPNFPEELYSTQSWNDGMNDIIENAKISLS